MEIRTVNMAKQERLISFMSIRNQLLKCVALEIDEEMLKEMCAFSNMSATSNVKKEGGFTNRPPPSDIGK